MHRLRHARHFAAVALAWFVLSLGIALLAPAMSGAYLLEDICSVDANGQDGSGPPDHVVHCPACVNTAAPPPAGVVAAVHLHAPAAAPLPAAEMPLPAPPPAPWTARGPPSLS
jgi:hypothetical protein